MTFLRKHWFDLGGVFALVIIIGLFYTHKRMSTFQLILWLNFFSLLCHQFEEYRFPGTFPGMVNTVMFKSDSPDRFPLNPNAALLINVIPGSTIYLLAAIFAEKAAWLAIIAILISAGNVIAHIFLFNLKGKSIYNAGMFTSLFLFLPCTTFFAKYIFQNPVCSTFDFCVGIPLGIMVNFGILKMIRWLARKNTPYVFEKRTLLH